MCVYKCVRDRGSRTAVHDSLSHRCMYGVYVSMLERMCYIASVDMYIIVDVQCPVVYV